MTQTKFDPIWMQHNEDEENLINRVSKFIMDLQEENERLKKALTQADQSAVCNGCFQPSHCRANGCVQPEPQAQAGEPEVVGYVDEFGNFENSAKQWMEEECIRGVDWYAVITLQSHREAIAKKDADLLLVARGAADAERNTLAVITRLHAEAAELRATLRACVEALEAAEDECCKPTSTAVRTAITQAQEMLT